MGNPGIFEKIKLPNIIIGIIVIFLAYNIYKNENKGIEELKAKIITEKDKNKILNDLAGLKAKMDAYLAILARKEVRVFISSIQNAAKESAVTITSIKPKSEQAKGDYDLLPFDLTVKAPDYHALAKFINKLENSKEVYVVDASDISPLDSDSGLKVNLTVSSIIMDEIKIESAKNEKKTLRD